MSSRLTTSDRVMLLMSLVPYLKEHGPTQVSELASMFGVDAPAVRKLVRFLGVAGVPGETQTYQHEDLFDIDWDALEQHDIVSLTQTVAVDAEVLVSRNLGNDRWVARVDADAAGRDARGGS